MAQNPVGNLSHAIDTGRNEALRHVRYEDLLRAVGSYVDLNGFTDVLVTQIPDGVLLKGTVIDRSTRSANEKITAILFTNDDIIALLDESLQRRGQTDQLRSRWAQQQPQ
ncbi:MAG: hypothetical protein ACRD1H_16855 [Vicinamibacterales bacterium]